MQSLHRGRRMAAAAVTIVALVTGTAVAQADESTASAPSGPQVIGGTARFPQYAIPAELDLSALPSDADPEREVSAVVQLAGDSALSASADQRVSTADAALQVMAGQQASTDALAAAGATIEGNITTVLNAVRVRVKVKDLQGLASVAGVTAVHVSRLIERDNSNSNALSNVTAVWQDLGVTGVGMTVAVIDTGIDYYHADFGGMGGQAAYEADDGLAIEPGTFPTVKVTAGYDFAGDTYDPGSEDPDASQVPVPDPDPLDCEGHGSHVAGTAAGAGVLADGSTYAGPYDATTMDNEFLVAPGAAPEAFVQSYKVFGCTGSAEDDIILAAIDAAVANGADVINMSLGSDLGSNTDVISQAVEAASAAGVLVVASAGNAGPGAYLVGSPSTANSALSVAAVDAVPVIPGVAVSGAITALEQNSNLYEFTAPVTGELVDVGLGCDLADYAVAVGKIAITTRGTCDRVARPQLATQAGAVGVIFINDSPGLPPVEGPIEGATVPFVGVTPEDGAFFQAAVGQVITLDAGADLPNPGYRHLASFTSAGARVGDSALKPDIAAAGVSVLSAAAGSGTGGIRESGTSMSSPHTAGIALLVRQTHPDWDPAAIKAAMMSTADPEGVVDYSARSAGAGLADAPNAVDTVAFISTEDGLNNLSFGYAEMPRGFWDSKAFQITNTSGSPITYDLAGAIDDAGTGATLSVNPNTVTVAPGRSRTVWATLRITDPSAVPGAADSDGGGLTAIDGFVVAQPRETAVGVHRLVTPLLMVPNAVSNIRATGVRTHSTNSKGLKVPDRIKLYNAGNHAGDADFYQWALSDPENDVDSSVAPDIRDVGVQSFPFDETGDLLVFAINTYDSANTQSLFQYEVDIDTTGDNVADFYLAVLDYGALTTGSFDGTYASALFDVDFNLLSLFGASAPANGGIVEAPVPTAAMGNPGLFGFTVFAASAYYPTPEDADITDIGYYDATAPAVTATDPELGLFPFISLAPKEYVPVEVSVDKGAAYSQNALGWLVVTTDDAAGAREADQVPLHP
jgi:minor extracellular serine protease Vpr